MRIYTSKKAIYLAGKIKEVRLLLGEFAGKNQTVREWIHKRLN